MWVFCLKKLIILKAYFGIPVWGDEEITILIQFEFKWRLLIANRY
jgi:hypothetical protein